MKPRYEPGQRVVMRGEEQTGRVQTVSFVGTFRYLVKWDRGFASYHNEDELGPGELPSTYP